MHNNWSSKKIGCIKVLSPPVQVATIRDCIINWKTTVSQLEEGLSLGKNLHMHRQTKPKTYCLKPHLLDRHTHTRLMALCPGLARWASTRKVKPIWILLKQETVVSAGTYASLHLAPDRLPRRHPTTQFNTGWMPFLPIYWIGLGIKTTANQVLTITEAQEHCCCNSWQVCTGRHEYHTQINSSVRHSYNLLHHISTKKCAVNDDKGSMRPTAGLLIGTGRGNMLSANWLGFHKHQLNDWQQQVKAILYTRAAGTGLEVDVCDKRRCRVRRRLQQTQLLAFILLLLFKMTSQMWKSSCTLCPPQKRFTV